MPEPDAAVTYRSYLALDEILGAQRPRSDEHDEILFIVVHQVYELWFKQLLHESAHLQGQLEAGQGPRALQTMRRILAILRTVVAQLDVLETLTPVQYTGFRDRLESASGFQSAQFRQLEVVFGRRDRTVLDAYAPGSAERARIEAAMARPTLFDSFLGYLARLEFEVPPDVLERDVSVKLEPSDGVQELLVQVYRQEGEGAQVAERLVDIDEGLQAWRYQHVKMVERTIGDKPGTGGSTGASYLRQTLFTPAFPDLWAVRSRL
ncbi:MAG TPA: tryptophan 2,3-dioxygenase family protein [Solirubrobacteraceae bacterium]|jgi:tryptophan 2,3-dioxygenase|nr:tryptophan 2,3-dioxygenase family protein [Solirubrobacteraceae bacterium]